MSNARVHKKRELVREGSIAKEIEEKIKLDHKVAQRLVVKRFEGVLQELIENSPEAQLMKEFKRDKKEELSKLEAENEQQELERQLEDLGVEEQEDPGVEEQEESELLFQQKEEEEIAEDEAARSEAEKAYAVYQEEQFELENRVDAYHEAEAKQGDLCLNKFYEDEASRVLQSLHDGKSQEAQSFEGDRYDLYTSPSYDQLRFFYSKCKDKKQYHNNDHAQSHLRSFGR